MEVQENAKLPTFNFPVDRSNASWNRPAPRGRRSLLGSRRRSSLGGGVGSGCPSLSGVSTGGDSSSIGGVGVVVGAAIANNMINITNNNGAVAGGATTLNNIINSNMSCPLSPIPKLKPTLESMISDHPNDQLQLDSATSHAIDEIMRLTENDMNLSESFLDGDDRSSAALAYSFFSSRGGMMPPLISAASSEDVSNSVKKTIGRARTGTNGVTPGITPGTGFGWNKREKPLPIPTLKKPSPPRAGPSMAAAAAAVATAAAIANRTSPTSSADTPTAPGGILDEQTVAALSVQPTKAATATAISIVPKPPLPHPPLGPPPIPGSKPIPTPIVIPKQPSTTTTPIVIPRTTIPRPTGPPIIPPPRIMNRPGFRPPHPHLYPPGHPYTAAAAQAKARHLASLHAAAHSKTKGSIMHATTQRSKFGFGGDHKVPSVPAPPPNVRGYPVRPPIPVPLKPGAGPSLSTSASRTFVPQPPTSPGEGLPKDVGTVIAYERKKQRAKNARVKLNEAIEELAVAIDLAGSQSKERFNYVTKVTGCVNTHVTATEGETASAPVPQHPLARLMDETIQHASTAKKWDRPSFVCLSATIIRSLNAQCEGLTREVAQLRGLAGREKINGADAVTSSPGISLSASSSPVNINGVHAQQNGIHENQTIPGHTAKKQKLDTDSPQDTNPATAANADTQPLLTDASTIIIQEQQQQQCLLTAIHSTIGTPHLLKNIASFLDPPSLCQCMSVSKRWRSQNIFQNTELWLDICIRRYGASAVRKWQDHYEEEEEEVPVAKKKKRGSKSAAVATTNSNTANMNLYHRMSEKNIKPYCPMEGSVFLGGSSLDGLVSCWASLMDRSNGETSRSVMQQKLHHDGETKQYYGPIPVVELRILVQNTGYSKGAIIIPDQQFSVDASTRRKGEKMLEVCGDDRFQRQVLHIDRRESLDGEPDPQLKHPTLSHEMCHLRLFESAVLSIHIHARGCSTTAKFCNRSKKIQLLVCVDGTTRPVVVPFHCVNEHQLLNNK